MVKEYVCGFYAVNQQHCVVTDHCIVCNIRIESWVSLGGFGIIITGAELYILLLKA